MTSKTHPDVPFEAYRGTAPYAFVSYAHDDAARVYPELERMRGYGFNLWYDEGISPGHDWPEELAAAIEGCALFLLFVSPRSVGSDNCNRETTFALGKERPFLAVHLEPTTLPRGLELSIGNSQAVLKHRMQPDAYEKKLVEALAASLGTPDTSDTSEQKPALAPVGQPIARATTETRSYVRAFTALGALVLIGGAIAAYQYFSTLTTERWITETAIPAIQRDLEQGRVLAAYAMTRAIEDVNPEDSSLQRLWPTVAVRGSVLSAPSGAIVSVRPLASDAGAWTILGTTPLEQFPLPNGNNFWRLDAGDDGTRTFFRGNYTSWFGTLPPGSAPTVIELMPAGAPQDAMLQIPAAARIGGVSSNFMLADAVAVPGFRVARDEVSNTQYKQFVDAGGYADPVLWDDLGFADAGRGLTWTEAIGMFVDSTGRPGPATWELGTYPPDKAAHPVGGISWYEAMAYARFRGRELPTLYHWMAVAVPFYASDLGPISNFAGQQSTAPDLLTVVGPVGTRHTFGNVREWLLNASGNHRWMMGGSWEDPAYMSAQRYSLPPLDRSPTNGVRLVEYQEPFPAEWREPITIHVTDYRNAEPVSDDAFAVIKEQFVDTGPPLEPRIERAAEDYAEWTYERVSVNAANADERLIINLYLPKVNEADEEARQAVVFFPSVGAFYSHASSQSPQPPQPPQGLEFIPRTGRVLVVPVFWGSYERYAGLYELNAAQRSAMQSELRRRWYTDLKRTIDYLETRDDIDAEKLAYMGISYGASHALPILALEKRLNAAVLLVGGLGDLGFGAMPTMADPVNYVSRITLPVLMLGGERDYIFPLETSQRPLYRLLGTPDEHKRLKLYDAGHWPLPRAALIRESADWLDRYLGEVQ